MSLTGVVNRRVTAGAMLLECVSKVIETIRLEHAARLVLLAAAISAFGAFTTMNVAALRMPIAFIFATPPSTACHMAGEPVTRAPMSSVR